MSATLAPCYFASMGDAPKGAWTDREPPRTPKPAPPARTDDALPADGRDTIGGHLRANIRIISVFSTLLTVCGAAYFDIRSQIGGVGERLTRVESRLDDHMQWHRSGVGALRGDPEPNSEPEPPDPAFEITPEPDEPEDPSPPEPRRPTPVPGAADPTAPGYPWGVVIERGEDGEPQPPWGAERLAELQAARLTGEALSEADSLALSVYLLEWGGWALPQMLRAATQECLREGGTAEVCEGRMGDDATPPCTPEMSYLECADVGTELLERIRARSQDPAL